MAVTVPSSTLFYIESDAIDMAVTEPSSTLLESESIAVDMAVTVPSSALFHTESIAVGLNLGSHVLCFDGLLQRQSFCEDTLGVPIKSIV